MEMGFSFRKKFVQDCGAELISDPLILNYENRRLCYLMGIFFVPMILNIKN